MPSHKWRNGNYDPRDAKQMILESTEIDLEKANQSKKLLKKLKSEFRKAMEMPDKGGLFQNILGRKQA